jgi:hypothetical protein
LHDRDPADIGTLGCGDCERRRERTGRRGKYRVASMPAKNADEHESSAYDDGKRGEAEPCNAERHRFKCVKRLRPHGSAERDPRQQHGKITQGRDQGRAIAACGEQRAGGQRAGEPRRGNMQDRKQPAAGNRRPDHGTLAQGKRAGQGDGMRHRKIAKKTEPIDDDQ